MSNETDLREAVEQLANEWVDLAIELEEIEEANADHRAFVIITRAKRDRNVAHATRLRALLAKHPATLTEAVERLEEDLGTALVPTWVVARVRSLLAEIPTPPTEESA